MSRTAQAASPVTAEIEAASATLDELIARGRARGHVSLSELRTAFSEAGITPAEGRSLLRELSDTGVRIANNEDTPVDPGDDDTLEAVLETTSKGSGRRRSAKKRSRKKQPTQAGAETTDAPEADLDDHSPALGDSVHTYLKAIGRRELLTAEQEVELAKRIEAGLYAEYKLGWLEESPGPQEMSETEREELEWIAEDGRRAKAHMLEANLRLVVSVAKKYSDRGMPLLDVVQEGNLGLIRAVEKFDYAKGYKFSTYAMWWIRQAIQRQELGKTPAQIEELLRITRQPISLDSTIGEDGETRIGDLIEDVDASEASEVVDRQLMADQLRRALDDLEPREATIMSLRFGLFDGRPRTLDEIGKHLGLTRERIRQLEKQSLSKLRHPSRARQLLDFAS